ncbi:MAG: endoribonuclease MazF [Lentisphaeria bacterium]|jgi:mRNA interferase MazF
MSYVPRRGDVVWLTFTPQAGHEQAGHRPALVLSPEPYNRKTGLAIFSPITSQVKGYPFEVKLPEGMKVAGVVLSDQVKSLDWRARGAAFCCAAPPQMVSEVLNKLGALLDT